MTTAVDLVGRSTDRGSALRIGRGWLAVVAGGCLAAATLVLTRRARAVGQAAGRYRTLVHSAGDLIAVLAADLRLDYVSPAAADVLGAPAATLTGLPFARLVHPDDEAGLFALVKTAHADPGTAHRAVLRLRHPDGRWRFGDVAVRSLLGDPVLDGLVVTVRDVPGEPPPVPPARRRRARPRPARPAAGHRGLPRPRRLHGGQREPRARRG